MNNFEGAVNNLDLLDKVIPRFEASPHVEGVFHYGALARDTPDSYSDIDLGVVSKNDGESFTEVCRLAKGVLSVHVEPVAQAGNHWGSSWMLSAVYDRETFPPIGTELDLVVLRLDDIAGQMPYATYRVILDRGGAVRAELDKLLPPRPVAQVREEIGSQIEVYPIFAFNAVKAFRRGDLFRLQTMLEEMRRGVFDAAAALHGEQVFGAKQAGRFVSQSDQTVLELSYVDAGESTVAAVGDLYVSLLRQLPAELVSPQDVERLSRALHLINP